MNLIQKILFPPAERILRYCNIISDDIEKSEKPKFQELGPYRFREKREKISVTFSEDNSEVNYREKR